MRSRMAGLGVLVGLGLLIAACGLPSGDPPSLISVTDGVGDTFDSPQVTPAIAGLQGLDIHGSVQTGDVDYYSVPLSALGSSHDVRVGCVTPSTADVVVT